jgi:hypothetical protein
MFSIELKEKVDIIERVVPGKWKRVVWEKIENEFDGCFSNHGFSRSSGTKVFMATKQYWLTKVLIAKCSRRK